MILQSIGKHFMLNSLKMSIDFDAFKICLKKL